MAPLLLPDDRRGGIAVNPQHGVPGWGWELLAGADPLGLMFALTISAFMIAAIVLRPRRSRY